MENIGQKIREIRLDKGISLTDLAEKINLSKSLISQVERNEVTPSLGTLQKIATALNMHLIDLFPVKEKIHSESDLIVRKDERKEIVLPNSPFKYQLLVPNLKRKMELSLVEMEPKSKEMQPCGFKHEGEECCFVLKGQLTFYYDNIKYILNEGDCVSFNSNIEHWMENETEEPVVYVNAMTPPFL